MGIDSVHPLYEKQSGNWTKLRDVAEGEDHIKSKGIEYLPATRSMNLDGMGLGEKGALAYEAYVTRAVFPEIFSETVRTNLGVLNSAPPKIELPKQLESLRERATLRGETIFQLMRRIYLEQLILGRVGLLLDVAPEVNPTVPLIALYNGDDITNWDDGDWSNLNPESLRMVVLRECGFETNPDGYSRKEIVRYRKLSLESPGAYSDGEDVEAGEVVDVNAADYVEVGGATNDAVLIVRDSMEPVYTSQLLEKDETVVGRVSQPSIRGLTLKRIPFVFVNAADIRSEPSDPPLRTQANRVLGIYRGEADYRQALFMQGQDTFVVLGGDETREYRIGANAAIVLPTNGDAKFVGVSSSGIPHMKEALDADYSRANASVSSLYDDALRERESGVALRIRTAGKTANLNDIALTAAGALQEILRAAAEWVGADPEEVVVTPNLKFIDDTMPSAELLGLITAKEAGAPLSIQTIHENMQNRGITQYSLEEELGLIQQEQERGIGLRASAGSANADGPVTDSEDTDAEDDDADGSAADDAEQDSDPVE